MAQATIASNASEWVEYVKTLIPFSAIFLAYLLGVRTYFRQKEYELVLKRYLEEGVDVIAQEADRALSIFWGNWSRSLSVIKQFRELGISIDTELYTSGFETLDKKGLFVRPNYKLKMLVNDDVFYETQQLVHSFVESANKFFTEDLCVAIRLRVEGDVEVNSPDKEIVERYTKELMKYRDKAKLYYTFIQHLENISGALETQKLSFKKLRKFHKTKLVKNSVSSLKESFKEKLQEYYDAEK